MVSSLIARCVTCLVCGSSSGLRSLVELLSTFPTTFLVKTNVQLDSSTPIVPHATSRCLSHARCQPTFKYNHVESLYALAFCSGIIPENRQSGPSILRVLSKRLLASRRDTHFPFSCPQFCPLLQRADCKGGKVRKRLQIVTFHAPPRCSDRRS